MAGRRRQPGCPRISSTPNSSDLNILLPASPPTRHLGACSGGCLVSGQRPKGQPQVHKALGLARGVGCERHSQLRRGPALQRLVDCRAAGGRRADVFEWSWWLQLAPAVSL